MGLQSYRVVTIFASESFVYNSNMKACPDPSLWGQNAFSRQHVCHGHLKHLDKT